jgi:hypothetical protein
MKIPASVTAFALVLALGSFGTMGQAYAYDDDGPSKGEAVVGIIGEVISGAVQAEQEKQEAREQERRCFRLQNKCENGAEWACEKYENSCGE